MKTIKAKVVHRGNGQVLGIRKNGKTVFQKEAVKKLNISHGDLPAEMGFTKPNGFDCLKFPWNLPSDSVEEAYCAYLLNRIPGSQRFQFMSELWRVLTPDGKCTVLVPYWSSPRSIQEPDSAWPPLVEQSFLYFNKNFRDTNKIETEYYSDFDFVYGYTLDPETTNKSDEVRAHWIKHFNNSVQDLQVTLTKRPKL
jgi:hypothetical protein